MATGFSEKLCLFKSLGVSQRNRQIETIRLSKFFLIHYDHNNCVLCLELKIFFKGTNLVIILHENGQIQMFVDNFRFSLEYLGNRFGCYKGNSVTLTDDILFYCSTRDIFVYTLKSEGSPIVNLSNSLMLVFENAPTCVLKYFPTVIKRQLIGSW